MVKITEPEYILMKKYIEEHCGIFLEDGKEYLIESRLSDLLIETGSNSFQELHFKARTDYTNKLRDRIIDAMTTNETLWFRDESLWSYLREVAIPSIIDKALKTGRARIWSAASSTGQEPYSILMLIDEVAKTKGMLSILDKIEIIATDISSSALFLAMAAKYDSMTINRGLPLDKKLKYFTQQKNVWVFDQELKKKVKFKKFNLQESFISLGTFDLILLRYVTIYFSSDFKKILYEKIANALVPKGTLILGATESLRGFTDKFEITYHKNALVNIKK
ncbi:MAG: protein-glutamate O-methyltransferase CheR [Desulfobacterales bacterium]|nr:protein-glutamate O-methyltransferase CheR [Desulfobacterales bacterium]